MLTLRATALSNIASQSAIRLACQHNKSTTTRVNNCGRTNVARAKKMTIKLQYQIYKITRAAGGQQEKE